MKLESRRERAERLKKQRRSTLAGMIIAIIVVVALGVVLWRINSSLYILTNWCLSLITSKIHTKYYVGAGRFFESFMLRHFIYKQSYILHIGVVPERKWI